MYKVSVRTKLRDGILDPQGQAVRDSLAKLGYGEVKAARVSKVIELSFDSKADYSPERAREMCEKLLVNEVMEDYEVTE